MSAITRPTEEIINDTIAELKADWDGQDELFFHDAALLTIMRNIGKVRSYLAAENRAEIRAVRKQFRERFCVAASIKVRRLQEGIAVYKKYGDAGDSVIETSQRIFQAVGGWSKALPAKPEEAPAEAEPSCKNCFHCPNP